MKSLKKYIYGAVALAAVSTLPACQDSFDEPTAGQLVPVATMTPNTKLIDVKELLWSDENNYCDIVYTKEWYETPADQRTEALKTEGTHIIVSGRVVSSDYAGNCFKYIVLQDETAALNFSINSYNLYLSYRVGQEIVVDLTGLNMGKYRGLEQVGFPSWNSSIPAYETSFMAPELFARNSELNGMPDPAAVDTLTVEKFSDLGVTPAELRYWQSRLVRFNNVEWVPNATLNTLSTYHSSGETQQIRDAEGNTLDVRTSGYANFWNMELPTDKCDVVALLGYYVNLAGTGGWQLTLIDANSILNVGAPTTPRGSKDNPYTVNDVVGFEYQRYLMDGSYDGPYNGWVRGYIVGTVKPEIEKVTSNADIDWSATPELGNTLVIGATADTKNIEECLVIGLPQGSDLRKYGALRENPDNYGKRIDIYGDFDMFMETFGLGGITGAADKFAIEGVNVGPVVPDEGDGSEDKPYSCAQIIAMNPSSTTDAVESNIWASGYVVGYYQDYAAHFEAGGTQRANILLSDTPSATEATQCICIQLVASTDTRNALNVVDNPDVLGKKVQVYGDVMKYNTLPGIKNTSNYKIEGGGTVTPPVEGTPEGDGTAANPYNVTAALQVAKALADGQNVSAYAKGTVESITELSTDFGNATYIITDGAAKLQVYRGYYLDGAKFTSADQLKVGDEVVISGDLVNYKGNTPQFTTGSKIVSINGGGTVTPPTPSTDYKGDFNSFNGGSPKSTYGTYTNAAGWQAVNCNVVGGLEAGATEQNPRFAFIGGPTTLGVTLNGKVGAAGTVTSPVLTGGCGTLEFKYGFPYADTQCSFTVQILQGGNIVKEETVDLKDFETKTAFTFTMPVGVTGDFQVKIVNNSASNKTTNTDRVSIWDLTWTD